MKKVTSRQLDVLRYICKAIKKKGYPPSVREIMKGIGLSSPASVQAHLIRLETAGLIRKDSSRSRTIEILPKAYQYLDEIPLRQFDDLMEVPLLGKITAGKPILAEENIEYFLPLPRKLTHSSQSFLVNVIGESMINEGIKDGDLALIRKQQDANNGDIIAALLGDEVTLKRFFKEKDRVRLQPENDLMSPIYTDSIEILGKLIALIRTY